MNKKSLLRLSPEERVVCEGVVRKLRGSPQKARRAEILLKADVNGPEWPEEQIAQGGGCRVQTVEDVRKHLVLEGFERTLNGQPREKPPTPCKLDGEGEAKLMALRLSTPPEGHSKWTLRLLADQLVKLKVVDAISPGTVRKVLKKPA